LEAVNSVGLPVRLVAFDLDGTLLRGRTVCECIADGIGRRAEMAAFERLTARADICAARETMADWYRAHGLDSVLVHLERVETAPGLEAGFQRLRQAGVYIALISITWRFAVQALAQRWGASFAIGTGLTDAWAVDHVWPEDKPRWLLRFAETCGAPASSIAAVGDSPGDVPMLLTAARSYFVGPGPLALPAHVIHWPSANIDDIARDVLAGDGAIRPPAVVPPER
jgi:phosphoserine phosphatase